jgi:hypothetical protein
MKTALRGMVLALLALAYTSVAMGQSPSPSSDEQDLHVNIPPQTQSDDATALAEKLQNPIGDTIGGPFQNNANSNVGPYKSVQNILNIQPVIPLHINEDWNVITRTILPLVWSPSLQPAESVPFGLAPITFSAFLSPAKPVNGWVWGAGPIAQVPTITSSSLGSNVWGAGPAVVAVRVYTPWVYGVLVNNVFSFGGTTSPDGTKYSRALKSPTGSPQAPLCWEEA